MIFAVYRHGGQGSAISRAKGDVFSLRGLTTSNLRFAGQARNDGDGLILPFLRKKILMI